MNWYYQGKYAAIKQLLKTASYLVSCTKTILHISYISKRSLHFMMTKQWYWVQIPDILKASKDKSF